MKMLHPILLCGRAWHSFTKDQLLHIDPIVQGYVKLTFPGADYHGLCPYPFEEMPQAWMYRFEFKGLKQYLIPGGIYQTGNIFLVMKMPFWANLHFVEDNGEAWRKEMGDVPMTKQAAKDFAARTHANMSPMSDNLRKAVECFLELPVPKNKFHGDEPGKIEDSEG